MGVGKLVIELRAYNKKGWKIRKYLVKNVSGYPESLSMSVRVMRLGCRGLKADEVNQAELRGEVGRFTNR